MLMQIIPNRMVSNSTVSFPSTAADTYFGHTLQSASFDIWARKYRLSNRQGESLEQDPAQSLERVARTLAGVEKSPAKKALHTEQFLWALQHGALPAGRILANAGAQMTSDATTLVNTATIGVLNDNVNNLFTDLGEAARTLFAGSGLGYEFSTLRPRGNEGRGESVRPSPGPLSIMNIYDAMCFSVSSLDGRRRGAQMATFDVAHPDVKDFIHAKRQDGRLRQFNLSLLISDDFIHAVEADEMWPLVFPLTVQQKEEILTNSLEIVWREWPNQDNYWTREDGLIACKVYDHVRARHLWDMIMSTTYDYAEPGIILIDRINEMNNNWWCENIRTTNSCAEEPLPPYGTAPLGSVNLTKFVRHPFTPKAQFDWKEFSEVVSIFTRMLDNVVDINGLPLSKQRNELMRKRRHGMGFLGLGSALAMLKMRYGSPEACLFTEDVTREMALVGWEVALSLAKEKGPAPIMDEAFEVTGQMLRKRPEMAQDGYKVGDRITGRLLHAKYSRYMQRIASIAPDLVNALTKTGARFTHHTSIAPTGTISLSFANNASNGIEPSFAHHYSRNVIRTGKKSKEKIEVFSYELLEYRKRINPQAMPFSDNPVQKLPAYFVTSNDVTPQEHVDIQAAAQKWVDSAISKTANVPTDYPFEDFKNIYRYAYQQRLKGCTTFRFNPTAFQGVLVKDRDLENTLYRFELDDGSIVETKGNEEIEYDGETHVAANLFDALKEGYYGRF